VDKQLGLCLVAAALLISGSRLISQDAPLPGAGFLCAGYAVLIMAILTSPFSERHRPWLQPIAGALLVIGLSLLVFALLR
jgi:hypothetical protein